MKTRPDRTKAPFVRRPGFRGLDKNSVTPLYAQLARLIRADITSGKWRRGDTLLTEMEMTVQYGVSRITVRSALACLVDEGLIYRQKGRGSVVKQGKLTRNAPGLLGIHEEIQATGRRPRTQLISLETVREFPAEIHRGLGLEEDEEAVRIRREIYADDELLGISTAYIPGSIWIAVGMPASRLANHSLYHLLDRSGYPLHEAEEIIEVVSADRELADRLKVHRGFPLFCLTRTVYTKEGVPIEWGQNILRTDKYQFRMHHWRSRQVPAARDANAQPLRTRGRGSGASGRPGRTPAPAGERRFPPR
jgi:GntR family transcriptional regulator